MRVAFLFILLSSLLIGLPLRAALVVDSVVSTPSSCQNNGTITVYAHDSIAINYAITAGPVTRPQQIGRVLTALPTGTYTVEVSDAAGHSLTQSVTVSGGYSVPTFAPKVIFPPCLNQNNFTLICNPDSASGRVPFTWELVAPSPVTAGPQGSDTFRLTQGGDYTIRCTDSCGNIQTRQYTVLYPGNGANISLTQSRPVASLYGCDSAIVGMHVYTPGDSAHMSFPYTFAVSDQYGHTVSFTQTVPILDSFVRSGKTTFYADYFEVSMRNAFSPVHAGDILYTMISDACGDTVRDMVLLPQQVLTVSPWNTYPIGGCQVADGASFTTTLSYSSHWVLLDETADTVLQSGVGNAASFTNYPPNKPYGFICFDACGDTLREDFFWPAPATLTPTQSYSILQNTCLDSTAVLSIIYDGFYSSVKLTFLSGPAVAHSTKPGYAYSLGYTYPKVYDGLAYTSLPSALLFTGMAPGHYVYQLEDSCGHILTQALDITPSDVASFSHSLSYQRGCPGGNILFCNYEGPTTNYNNYVSYTISDTGATLSGGSTVGYGGSVPVFNISSGSYTVELDYVNFEGTSFPDSTICNTVYDTITIPPYQDPILTPLHTYNCGSTLYIYAYVDTNVGVYPYTYSIVSGPETFPAQSDYTFPVTQTGTYTILALDACGNGTTQSISIDSLVSHTQIVTTVHDSCFHVVVDSILYTADVVRYDTIRTALGCDSLIFIDSVIVRGDGDQLPILTVAADTFCITKGGTVTAVRSYTSYLWSDGSTGFSVHAAAAGSYGLTVTDAAGCMRSDAAMVSLVDSPYITSGWYADTAACPDAPVVVGLSVSDPDAHYIWGGTDAGVYSLTRTITDSGIYSFSIANQCASSTYTMNVANKMYCYEYLYVPNAFTPNGDGNNDVFLIYTDYNLKLTDLRIFDRWGEKVYEGHDESQGWDGTYRGAAQPGGIYVYELAATWISGNTFHRKGSVTLLR